MTEHWPLYSRWLWRYDQTNSAIVQIVGEASVYGSTWAVVEAPREIFKTAHQVIPLSLRERFPAREGWGATLVDPNSLSEIQNTQVHLVKG